MSALRPQVGFELPLLLLHARGAIAGGGIRGVDARGKRREPLVEALEVLAVLRERGIDAMGRVFRAGSPSRELGQALVQALIQRVQALVNLVHLGQDYAAVARRDPREMSRQRDRPVRRRRHGDQQCRDDQEHRRRIAEARSADPRRRLLARRKGLGAQRGQPRGHRRHRHRRWLQHGRVGATRLRGRRLEPQILSRALRPCRG